jgi:hypothetical protein
MRMFDRPTKPLVVDVVVDCVDHRLINAHNVDVVVSI